MPQVNAEFVMSAVEILGVSCADHFGRAQPFKTAHWPQPEFQATVICFDRVIQALPHYMTGARQQLVEYSRIGGCPVGSHLSRCWAVSERTGEESAGGREILFLGHQDVDDLSELVDRPVQVNPPPNDFDAM